MRKFYATLPAIALIAANILPLIGVVKWGWSLTSILWLYWLESFVIGMINIPKIALSTGTARRKIRMILFFMIHYGGFWLAHGLFILILLMPAVNQNPILGDKTLNTDFDLSFKWAVLSLFISHGISFGLNFIRREKCLIITPEMQMFMPYTRVVILHVLILGGSYLAAKFGTSVSILFALIALKIIVDLITHIKVNRPYNS